MPPPYIFKNIKQKKSTTNSHVRFWSFYSKSNNMHDLIGYVINKTLVRKKVSNYLPIPPDVPMRKTVTLVHLAWYSSLMSSCSIIAIEGMPIPCWNKNILTVNTHIIVLVRLFGFLLIILYKDKKTFFPVGSRVSWPFRNKKENGIEIKRKS